MLVDAPKRLDVRATADRTPASAQGETMPLISEVRESKEPLDDEEWENIEFPSPDRSWVAVLHDPDEWHMGAMGWQLSIRSSDGNPLKLGPKVSTSPGRKSLSCPVNYSPWSSDSTTLALCSWETGLGLFQPSSSTFRGTKWHPFLVQWSPAGNDLLIFQDNQFVVLSQKGRARHKIAWKTAPLEFPRAGWLKAGKTFYVVGRASKRAKTTISFVSAESGEQVATELLDPAELVPYASEEYATVSRGRYSLLTSYGRSVGSLLDTWDQVLPNQEDDSILLSVYRPKSKVCEFEGSPVCEVEKKWVSVRIRG